MFGRLIEVGDAAKPNEVWTEQELNYIKGMFDVKKVMEPGQTSKEVLSSLESSSDKAGFLRGVVESGAWKCLIFVHFSGERVSTASC